MAHANIFQGGTEQADIASGEKELETESMSQMEKERRQLIAKVELTQKRTAQLLMHIKESDAVE